MSLKVDYISESIRNNDNALRDPCRFIAVAARFLQRICQRIQPEILATPVTDHSGEAP